MGRMSPQHGRALVQSSSNEMTSQHGAEQQAMRKQLEQVLAHPAFSGAPRLSSLLRFIVGETLDGRGDQLKEYTLGLAVFGRGSRFDPASIPLSEWKPVSSARVWQLITEMPERTTLS